MKYGKAVELCKATLNSVELQSVALKSNTNTKLVNALKYDKAVNIIKLCNVALNLIAMF